MFVMLLDLSSHLATKRRSVTLTLLINRHCCHVDDAAASLLDNIRYRCSGDFLPPVEKVEYRNCFLFVVCFICTAGR